MVHLPESKMRRSRDDFTNDSGRHGTWYSAHSGLRHRYPHLKRQILPGIAAYETLQRIMPKEEALQTVHGYVERLARTSHKQLAALLHIPGLYRLVPGVFVKSTRSVFGPAAGFDSKELQVGNGIWRVDMMKCPYHDTCVAYGCPELCRCFCDSDDISYTALHPKLIWHRTKTLGRGDDRCDFCMKIMK
ncbi:L-2-amino-thiazoline-4-carboxylic acid hydrolase [Butyricicoccus sp.]|uniref:L-2-amino-thiazoline-4-carboxylic acid hydrolase n=1 Tax=Butyricicoccus sp. TaxID=2049021 RepID=UPI003AAC6015